MCIKQSNSNTACVTLTVVLGLIFYLEAAIVGAEFLSQHGVICIKGFLLQAAVHQNMNNLSLLFVLQAHPSHRAKNIF